MIEYVKLIEYTYYKYYSYKYNIKKTNYKILLKQKRSLIH